MKLVLVADPPLLSRPKSDALVGGTLEPINATGLPHKTSQGLVNNTQKNAAALKMEVGKKLELLKELQIKIDNAIKRAQLCMTEKRQAFNIVKLTLGKLTKEKEEAVKNIILLSTQKDQLNKLSQELEQIRKALQSSRGMMTEEAFSVARQAYEKTIQETQSVTAEVDRLCGLGREGHRPGNDIREGDFDYGDVSDEVKEVCRRLDQYLKSLRDAKQTDSTPVNGQKGPALLDPPALPRAGR